MKEKHFDSNKNMESLETVWISKANASQRKGECYQLKKLEMSNLFIFLRSCWSCDAWNLYPLVHEASFQL